MKYIVFFYISISILFFSGCKPNIVLEQNTVIKNNTVWEGTIHIKGDVFVDKGVKLIIKPGSIIIFDILKQNVSIDEMIKEGPYSPQAELIINGAIEAEGTSEKPIIFTSKTDKDKVKEGQWGSINFIGSEHGSLKYCEIRGAYMGVHIHSSTISIENCKFINNYYGVRMKQSDEINEPCMVNITHSIFENNDTGISLRNAICNADSNILQKNKIAIWLKEGVIIKIVNNTIKDNTKGIFFTNTPKIRITKNNIFGNNYNIYLGENQKEDIDALNNWWGSAVPEEIEKKILDQKWDSSLGTVNYIPFLHNPN